MTSRISLNALSHSIERIFDSSSDEEEEKKTLTFELPKSVTLLRTGHIIAGDGNQYFGEIRGSKKWGFGRTFDSEGKLISEGMHENDLLHGAGIQHLENGNVYHGLFKEGLFHGYGSIINSDGKVKFEGTFLKGSKQSGQEPYDDIRTFFGAYKKGNKKFGYLLTPKTGDQKTDPIVYVGFFENNQPTGEPCEIVPPPLDSTEISTIGKEQNYRFDVTVDSNKKITHAGFFKKSQAHGLGYAKFGKQSYSGMFYQGRGHGFGILKDTDSELRAQFDQGTPQTGSELIDKKIKFVGTFNKGIRDIGVLIDLKTGQISSTHSQDNRANWKKI